MKIELTKEYVFTPIELKLQIESQSDLNALIYAFGELTESELSNIKEIYDFLENIQK